MKIYLDTCCLNRPFDNQDYPRIHFESEAVKIILEKIENAEWQFISSEVLLFEINKILNLEKRQKIKELLTLSSITVQLDDSHIERAKFFENSGLKAFDALHIGVCESNADVFLTVDDRLIKILKKFSDLKLIVMNPIDFIKEYI